MQTKRPFASAIALWLAAAAPAAASGTPPMGLERGHGSVGLGAFRAHADVAVQDGVTVGALAYTAVFFTFISARMGYTMGPVPGGYGTWGVLGQLSYDNSFNTGYPFYMGPGYQRELASYSFGTGLMYASPRGPAILRASLVPGVRWKRTGYYDNGPGLVPELHLGTEDQLSLQLYPVAELAFPMGDHFEFVLGGGSFASVVGRW